MQTLPSPGFAPQRVGAAMLWDRWLAKCLVGCFLSAWALAALAASVVDVQTTRQGDLVDVQAKAVIKAPLELVWATLTDYERLPEFIPGLKKSRIIARNGATTTVEQTGVAQFLFLTVPIEVTVESTEKAPHTIEVRRIAGTLRQLQGRYETEALPDQGAVQLRWVGSIEPENRLPPLVGESMIRHSIQSQFTGMVREIERREAARKRSAKTAQPNATPQPNVAQPTISYSPSAATAPPVPAGTAPVAEPSATPAPASAPPPVQLAPTQPASAP
jgi:ribosome-associated toxin RatA of RatAB toxin-antitoxin module